MGEHRKQLGDARYESLKWERLYLESIGIVNMPHITTSHECDGIKYRLTVYDGANPILVLRDSHDKGTVQTFWMTEVESRAAEKVGLFWNYLLEWTVNSLRTLDAKNNPVEVNSK